MSVPGIVPGCENRSISGRSTSASKNPVPHKWNLNDFINENFASSLDPLASKSTPKVVKLVAEPAKYLVARVWS